VTDGSAAQDIFVKGLGLVMQAGTDPLDPDPICCPAAGGGLP